MKPGGLEAYLSLEALTEREHALVRGGRFEELGAVQAEREFLVDMLPAVPPEAAYPIILRTAARQAQTAGLLDAARRRTADELARLGRGRTVVGGYGAGTQQEPSRTLDLRR